MLSKRFTFTIKWGRSGFGSEDGDEFYEEVDLDAMEFKGFPSTINLGCSDLTEIHLGSEGKLFKHVRHLTLNFTGEEHVTPLLSGLLRFNSSKTSKMMKKCFLNSSHGRDENRVLKKGRGTRARGEE